MENDGGERQVFSGLLGDLQEEFGDEVIARILEIKGGGRVSIPASTYLRDPEQSHHWLIELFGIETAVSIAKFVEIGAFYGKNDNFIARGATLDLPTGRNAGLEEAIFDLIRRDYSADRIARMLKCSRRTVYRKKSKLRQSNNLNKTS